MTDWYYGNGTDRLGPVSPETLQQLVATGQLGPGSQVWCKGMPAWVPAASLPFLQTQRRRDDGGALNLLLPMAPQSGFAIAAGYLGLFSFFMVTAPLAIIFGVLGLRDIKAHPEKRGVGRAITGIVLGSLCTLFYGWIYLLYRS
jgi:hypothetical protein